MNRFQNLLVNALGILGSLVIWFTPVSQVYAGVTSKVLQDAFEFTTRKFSKEVAEEGAERIASKMSALAARHSDEVVAQAFKRVGPRVANLVKEAGEHCDDAIRLLAKHGDAAIPLVSRRSSLGIVKQFGHEAAEACMKHGTVAEPLIVQFGETGAKALTQVSERSGRQLAILANEGALKPELIDLVYRHGDKCCEFLWKNKGVIAGGAALAAFVSAPEEFLNGTAQLTETVITPIAESVAKPMATAAVESIPWGLLLALSGVAAAIAYAVWRVPHTVKTHLLNSDNEAGGTTLPFNERR